MEYGSATMGWAHRLGAGAALALLVACGDGTAQLDAGSADANPPDAMIDDVAPAADASDSNAGSAGDARDAPITVFFAGTIYRRNSDLFILGAEVCLLDQPQACEITDSVSESTFNTAPQHGQVRSKVFFLVTDKS